MSGTFGLIGKPYPARSASAAHVAPSFGRPYEAARRGGVHGNWRPPLRSADADWLEDRDDPIAKARDIGRNEGVGAYVFVVGQTRDHGFILRRLPR